MAIRVTCEACRQVLDVRDEFAGRRGKCPHCNASVQVPAATPDKADEKAATETAPAAHAAKPAPPRRTAKPAPADPQPSLGIVVDAAPHAAPTGRAGGEPARASVRRKPRSVAVWVWAGVAFVGVSCLAVLGVYAAMSGGKGREAAGGKSTKPGATNVATSAATPHGKGRDSAKSNENGSGFDFSSKAVVAHDINEVKQAIVKFEMPSPDGMGEVTGTGFLINDKAWVATNWHVAENATTAAHVRMANGVECTLAGIVAKAPEYDLAIVKLAEHPAQLTVLNIGFQGDPQLATDVLAFGHPMNEDFVVRKGTIGTILTTADLLREEKGHNAVLEHMKAPGSLVWIRHDTGILPGNSGGPLFLSDGRVVGVNTWISTQTRSGYASHIQYLRELVAKARDVVEPLPDIRAAAPVDDHPPPFYTEGAPISVAKMAESYAAVEKTTFLPADATQYQAFAELARQMTYARYAKLGSQQTPPDQLKQRAAQAAEFYGKMRKFAFTPKHVQAINTKALELLPKANSGLVFFGVVSDVGPGMLLVRLESRSTEGAAGDGDAAPPPEKKDAGPPKDLVCVPLAAAGSLEFGTRVLVVGVVSPESLDIRSSRGKSYKIPMLLSHYVGELK